MCQIKVKGGFVLEEKGASGIEKSDEKGELGLKMTIIHHTHV